MKHLPLLFLPLLILTACDNEFSPNAEWKEVPSVYCLLDQDDDTTFVRVQKCYLGEGNLYAYAQVFDSTNYPQGSIAVKLKAWRNFNELNNPTCSPLFTLDFNYTETDKVPGSFGGTKQPIYYHVNQDGELNPDYCYQLVVTKQPSGEVLTSATTILIGNEDPDKGWLINPFPATGANAAAKTFNLLTGKCDIKWRPMPNGRLYQPCVRFYYRYRYAPEQLRYLDIECPNIKSVQGALDLTTEMEKNHYLNEIAKALNGDTNHKKFVDTVGIRLYVCNEDLNAYINTTTGAISTDQNRTIYSNIPGGVGIFGARRTHLFEKVLADNGTTPQGMHTLLENLLVGFEP